jgi:CMP/dCMP kinase
MKISISGTAGSGKSSVAKLVAQKLGYKYHYIGELMRKMAKKRGIDFHELAKLAEAGPEVDKELDDMQKALGKEDNFIIDSRLGFHFIPDSYKIFLKADIKKAAQRIFAHNREEEKYKSLGEAEQAIKRRMLSEQIRYKKHYGIVFPNESAFDLVIDTSNMTIEQVADEILKEVKEKK